MKNLFVVLFVLVVGRVALGCSDDGVYTPVGVPDAGQDAPLQACAEKDGCSDAGAEDAAETTQACVDPTNCPDASKGDGG